jgi:DNA-directed RNA polymerase specialized sigma24 family protein
MLKIEFTATNEAEIALVEEFLAKVREERAAEREALQGLPPIRRAAIIRDREAFWGRP